MHQQLVPQVPAPVILHCCGPTLDRIQYFREAGFKAFHFESQVKPDKAVIEAAGKINLPPGFKAELVHEVPAETEGSWVALTPDDKGRLIASVSD